MIDRRWTSFVLATIWLLAIGHCLSERLSAHWHLNQEKKAEHHHHSSHGSHHHDTDQGSEDGSSHGVADHECCELFDSSRPAPQFDELQTAELVGLVYPFSPKLISDSLFGPRTRNNPTGAPPDLRADRHFLVQTLIIANAPPTFDVV